MVNEIRQPPTKITETPNQSKLGAPASQKNFGFGSLGETARHEKDPLTAAGAIMLANIRHYQWEQKKDPEYLKSAIVMCTRAIEYCPETDAHFLADAYFLRSGLLAEMGRYADSQSDMAEVRRLNPVFALEFVFRAKDFHHVHTINDVGIGELRKALRAADEVIGEYPDKASAPVLMLRSQLHTVLYKRTKDSRHFLQSAKDMTRALALQLHDVVQA